MLVLVLTFTVAVLDQATKYLVRLNFFPGEVTPIVPGFFNLAFVRNTGAAWGMFGGLNGWLALLSVVMLIAIVVFRRSFLADVLAHKIAMGLMIGGITGNLVDRLRLQYVVDFLDFHWRLHHFPAFNVADASICVGVGLYILSSFLPALRARKRDRAPDQGHAVESGDTVSSPGMPGASGEPH
jgi:signal peptidase II